jgi:hypothetical protein
MDSERLAFASNEAATRYSRDFIACWRRATRKRSCCLPALSSRDVRLESGMRINGFLRRWNRRSRIIRDCHTPLSVNLRWCDILPPGFLRPLIQSRQPLPRRRDYLRNRYAADMARSTRIIQLRHQARIASGQHRHDDRQGARHQYPRDAARRAAAHSLNGLSAQSQDAVSAFTGRVN